MMLDKIEAKVEINPVITIDENTAYTLLRLLEMYCTSNGYKVISHEDEDGKVQLDFD